MKIFTHEIYGKLTAYVYKDTILYSGMDAARGLGIYLPKEALITRVFPEHRMQMCDYLMHCPNGKLAVYLKNNEDILITYEGIVELSHHEQLDPKVAPRYVNWVRDCVVPRTKNIKIRSGKQIAHQDWNNPKVDKKRLFYYTADLLDKTQKIWSATYNKMFELLNMKKSCYSTICRYINKYAHTHNIPVSQAWVNYYRLLEDRMNHDWLHVTTDTFKVNKTNVLKIIDTQGLPTAIALAVELAQG